MLEKAASSRWIHNETSGGVPIGHRGYYTSIDVPVFGIEEIYKAQYINREMRNMLGARYYEPQCINRGNGHVTNDHLQAIIRWFCVTSSSLHDIKSTFYQHFFFMLLWLFDFLALLVLLAFASSTCRIYQLLSKHRRN